LRSISRDLVANIVLAAGANIVGKVGVDQTTPGTTDSVTVATGQGAGAAIGATTGAAVVTDANGTIQQYLRGLIKQWIAGTLVIGAGTNLIGKFGIDQTTPGTTNGVQITAITAASLADRSNTVANGGTAQQLMASNASRKGWSIQNNSSGDLWVNEIGGTAVATQPSWKIGPGDSAVAPLAGVSTSAISILGATTGQTFTAREW
jgi:hypothetical protein